MRRFHWVLVLAVGLHALAPGPFWRHTTAAILVIASVFTLWWANRALPRTPTSWTLFCIGITVAGASHVLERLMGIYPVSVARLYELGYGIGYVLLVAGMLGLARGRRLDRWTSLTVTLEAVAFGASCYMLSWLLVIDPADPATTLDAVVASGYPFVDVVLVAIVMRVILSDPLNPAGWWLMVSALVVLAGDLAYAAGATPEWASVGWVATYPVVAIAASHRSLPRLFQPSSGHRPGPAQLVTTAPALLALAAVPAFAAGGWRVTWPVGVLAAVVALAVIGRLASLLAHHGRIAEELETLATRDALTGLPNRRHLYEHFTSRMPQRSDQVLLFIDLDGFKDINDRWGHDVGDRVLAAVANRLAGTLREADQLWRLAGDEFVALCAGSAQQVPVIIGRITSELSQPLVIGDLTLTLSASIGALPFDPERSVDEQLAEADRAMYVHKSRRTRNHTVG